MYRIGPLRIDPEHLTIFADDAPLAVGSRVVATLVALCERPGEVVGKDELLRRVWPGGCIDESSLWQNVHLARRLLRAHAGCEGIENVRGRGYRLSVPVTADASPRAAQTRRRSPGNALARVAALGALFALVLAPGPTPLRSALARGPSAEGLRLYRLGSYYLNLRTPKSALRGLAIFRRETLVDGASALGYAGVADAAHVLAMMYDGTPPGRRFCADAVEAARRALSLDPASPQAQTSYATTRELVAGRYGVADGSYREALAADPGYAPAHLRYGISLLMRAHVSAAVSELRQAAQLEPVSVINNFWLASALYAAHEPAAAERYARIALELGPHDDDVKDLLARIYEANHRYAAARAMSRAAGAACCPRVLRAMDAETYAASGDTRRARAELRRVHLEHAADVNVWLNVALAQLALRDRAAALRALEHVHLTAPMDRALFALDPRLDTVRNDPRFAPWTRLS